MRICWSIRGGGGGVRREKVGMNFISFQLLFVIRWEISHFFVSNEKLFLTSYSLVNAIRAFVFHDKNLSYARISREESLLFALNENSRFISQCS